jgi:hypothetical protein
VIFGDFVEFVDDFLDDHGATGRYYLHFNGSTG